MTRADGGNIIGAMVQAVEIYIFDGRFMILYLCERFYADMHLFYFNTLALSFLAIKSPLSQQSLTSGSAATIFV